MPHKLTYTHSLSLITSTIQIDEDATLPQMIEAFELYLKVCEYNIDGQHLELVDNNHYLKNDD